MGVYDQAEFAVRCEWGMAGVKLLSPISAVLIVVDVLSFTTCVDVVVGRGGTVFPYDGPPDEAATLAREVGAVVAGRRGSGAPYSLSPAALLDAPAGLRLVLPSPNGSRLSAAAKAPVTLAGCLRNARAVAIHAAQVASRSGKGIALVPAGERWWPADQFQPDDRLRPSYEDWLGVGAIASHLDGPHSPETAAAVAAFHAAEPSFVHTLLSCSSGKELQAAGHEQDVRVAARLDVSATVPHLRDGAYQQAAPTA